MKENKNSDHNFSESFNDVNQSRLVLYNDDINTFQFVIDALIEHCNFDELQAEQLATLAHFKGKAVIKTGQYILLQVLKDEFNSIGLTVEIE